MEFINKSKKTSTFFKDYKKFFLLVLATLPTNQKLTKLSYMNNIMASIPCMYKIEHCMQICLQNTRIACSTDHAGNLLLRELKLKKYM